MLCPNGYGEPETFVALVTGSLERDAARHDWKRIQISPATPSRAKCRSESHYIRFPAVILIPTAPSSKVAKARRLFVHVDKEDVVYRIARIGDSARVETINLETARKNFPGQLNEPEPRVSTPAWDERIHLTVEYYRSRKWHRSDRIAISDTETDADGAVLSVRMTIGMTVSKPLERPGLVAPADAAAASPGRSALALIRSNEANRKGRCNRRRRRGSVAYRRPRCARVSAF